MQTGNKPGNGKKPYAVRAVLVKGQQILLIHHAGRRRRPPRKCWTFPGGRLDPDETDPVTALRREMHEELSLEIEVLGQIGRYYSRLGSDYVIYAARPLGPIGPVNRDEVRDLVWLTPAEVYEWHCQEKLQFGFEMDAVLAYLRNFT